MLARRALSEGEIGERLAARGFGGEEVGALLHRLRELGLVDDRGLCGRLARSYRDVRRYGPRKVAAALRARRFPSDLVEEILRESSSEEADLAAASAALGRKFPRGVPAGREGAAKAYRFLAGRGFAPETCRLALRGRGRGIEEGEG